MYQNNGFHAIDTSISDYAAGVLQFFENPIATERMDALLYMTVGSGRVRTLTELTNRMRKHLRPETESPKPGLYFEQVLGEFGSGKSHIGYMLKHNALTLPCECLVSHVQITAQAPFTATLASLLRSLRISTVASVTQRGIELSAYRQLFGWCGKSVAKVAEVAAQAAGNLPDASANDFAHAVTEATRDELNPAPLQRFLHAWIEATEPKAGLEVFEMIMRVFARLGAERLVLIIDEFEAISALDQQRKIQVLQAYQDLHDDFAGRVDGLPSTYLCCFSTRQWAQESANILPSLLDVGQRTKRQTALPDVDEADISGLIYRYLGLYMLAHPTAVMPGRQQVDEMATSLITESAGDRHHVRRLHMTIRDRIEQMLSL